MTDTALSLSRNIVNPFYAARLKRYTSNRPTESSTRYAKLPRAPRNASPVPRLTSLYHWDEPGPYGSRRYPGNCSGLLIKDLLTFYGAKNCLDPMTGSGTCKDVCDELGISCISRDLKTGHDACDLSWLHFNMRFDFAWLHPPYYRQKIYSNDPRDLSAQPTLEAFLGRYQQLIEGMARVLKPHGKLAILMGDYSDFEYGFIPLVYHTKKLAFDAGLRQCTTDIIRFSHNAGSSHKVYNSSFIPGLHDTCVVFERTPNTRSSS